MVEARVKPFVFAALLLLVTGAAFARVSDEARIAEVKKEFKPSSKHLTVFRTKHGYRYYFQPPGPCSCPSDDSVVICTPRFDKLRADQWRTRPEIMNVACPPNAGCAKGFFTVWVDCPSGKKVLRKR